MPKISEEEKSQHIKNSFEIDRFYLKSLDCLRDELIQKGIDPDSGEGRKIFIRAVRRLNEKFLGQ